MSTVPSNNVEAVRLKNYLAMPPVKARIEELMKDSAGAFVSSIMAVVGGSKQLQECDPTSLVAAGLQAAAMKFPVSASLGFAHIVPYGNKAQFQIGWKGFIQLAQRTGQYAYIQPSVVHEGQLVENDPFTGKLVLDAKAKKSDVVVGYLAYFELVTGFKKYLFMSSEDMERHAKRYSKTYQKGYGPWKDDFDAMGLKTVLKMALSKFGPLSVDMQKAVEIDQAVVSPDLGVESFPDAVLPAEEEAPPTTPTAAAEILKPQPKEVPKSDLPISPIIVEAGGAGQGTAGPGPAAQGTNGSTGPKVL